MKNEEITLAGITFFVQAEGSRARWCVEGEGDFGSWILPSLLVEEIQAYVEGECREEKCILEIKRLLDDNV